jgi:metal-dependent amidase/aminoacylase/carboxypeptidase family protein
VNDDISDKISNKIKGIVGVICELNEIEYNIELSSCPRLNNDLNLARFVENISKKYNFNVINVNNSTPIMGSDDFARYCEKVPGVYFGIGGKDEIYSDINPHTGEFDFNDKIIPYALEIFIRIIEEKSNSVILN